MKLLIEILLCIGFGTEIILGFFVFIKNRHKLTNIFFCILMFCGALWNILLALAIILSNSYLSNVSIVCGLFANAFFLLFSWSFGKLKTSLNKITLFVALIIPILLTPIILFANNIINKTIFYNNGLIEITDGSLAVIFYMYHLLYSIIAFYFLIRSYKSSSGIIKIQFQYLLMGLGFVLSWFFITNLILPVFNIYHLIH